MSERASHQTLTRYRPNQRHDLGFFTTWRVMAKNVIRSRELIWQLFKRDFLAQYKKSFIGITWIFISPIIGIISWVFLQQAGVLQPGDVGIPYPAYVLIGSSIWGLFMGFYRSSCGTLKAGASFIMQVNYPHEALLFKQVAQKLADFSIGFVLNILVLLAFKVVPSWKIVLLPFVTLPMFFLGSAMGLIVSMVSVVAFDLNRGINMLMGLLLYLTPVIYSNKVQHPLIQTLIRWNPLTYLVCSARDIVIYGQLYDPLGYALCASLSLLLFLVSWRLFFVSEHALIERMI
jgi:lipopolysaccharide transport system permease protein